MIHRYFVWLHRWTGLLMTAFLVVVGLTGTILAFRSKIDHLLNPQFYAEVKPGQTPLDPATLAERAEALVPEAKPGYFSVGKYQVSISIRPRKNPATGQPYDLPFDHLILDPYTGEELGRCCADPTWRVKFMPFIYQLHTSVALGNTGAWILGIVALVWTLDCFVGFYLTLPRGPGGFWRRWKYAWQTKWRANAFRINFDLHRAGGLWSWVLLFVFAWSSVMLSLRPVYDHVTKTVFDYHSDEETISSVMLSQPLDNPKLGWREAQTLGERAMARVAAQHGFTITRPYGMAYIPEFGVYTYAVRGSNDIRGEGWDTSLWVDGNTGALRDVTLPSGQHAGNTVSTVLWGLHYGDIRNFLPYRILVAFFGLVLTVISVTGVYIWWKKRKGRKLAALAKTRIAGTSATAVINTGTLTEDNGMRKALISGLLLLLVLVLAGRSALSVAVGQELDGKILSSKPWPPLPKYDSLDEFGRGYFPESVYEEAHTQKEFDVLEITYASDGLSVRGLLIKPKAPGTRKWPAIIFNRGGNGELGRITDNGQPCGGMANTSCLDVADLYLFAKAGFVVIASDYRYQGATVKRDEWGGVEVDDVLNLVPTLKSLAFVDPDRLYMLGLSRGGTMTYLAIKRGISVKAAAVIGGVTDVKAWVDATPGMGLVNGNQYIDGFAKIWPDYEHRAEEYYRARSAVYWADQINVPVLILHSRTDRLVPVTQALRMAEALQEKGKVYALHIYDRDGHALPQNREDRNRMIIDWFHRASQGGQ